MHAYCINFFFIWKTWTSHNHWRRLALQHYLSSPSCLLHGVSTIIYHCWRMCGCLAGLRPRSCLSLHHRNEGISCARAHEKPLSPTASMHHTFQLTQKRNPSWLARILWVEGGYVTFSAQQTYTWSLTTTMCTQRRLISSNLLMAIGYRECRGRGCFKVFICIISV
jgi:hypothetical protein